MNIKRLFAAASAGMLVALAVPGAAFAATTTTTVTPSNMHGWVFYNDETDVVNNALGSFVAGPGNPPAGTGSARISVSGTQRVNLATYQFANTVLSDITEMKFSTYNPTAGNGEAAPSNRSGYLNFNVDFDGSDTWQKRLVFLPSDNGVISQNTWQEWDTIAGGNALWRYSGALWPVTGGSGTTPKTWSQILADYPGVSIRNTDAHVGVRVGEPYANGYTENIDKFVFGTAASTTTFDFEPTVTVPNKDACKNGGWETSNSPVYKNQGDCVSSFASNGKAKGNPAKQDTSVVATVSRLVSGIF